MRYDEEKIAKILDSIKEEDLDYSPITWIEWDRLFYNSKVRTINEDFFENLQEYKNRWNKFKESNLSEESFKKNFPNYTFDKYIHPNEIDPDLKTINLKTKQRVALELTEVAKDLTYTQIFAFVDLFFDMNNISEWIPEYFIRKLSSKYPEPLHPLIDDYLPINKVS